MALYRKYRPASFAEVIGQEHVTQPLQRALDSGKINHAYLFSGPRGCGKTSSARILARSLNCEHGPAAQPCGDCDSCIQLAPGGSGNLDVVELDAASHGGVDDTRDLRDRAFYAPVSSHYRVFIIDEAHMVSTAGFNALLKIVEEPPEHVIFIFATTEPEKVIPTIRSRTHHYPFRLLGPTAMKTVIDHVIDHEDITIEKEALQLLIRAGGGSPRDTLSILDQLIAGSENNTVTLELTSALLGVTDSTIVEQVITSIAHRQGEKVFSLVEQVIESGQDPRRFIVDLLEKYRDIILIQSIPDAPERGLVHSGMDSSDTLRELSLTVSSHQLAHNAQVLIDGLSQLRGATSPRLLVEVIIAQLLVTQNTVTMLQRIEQLEKYSTIPVSNPLNTTEPYTNEISDRAGQQAVESPQRFAREPQEVLPPTIARQSDTTADYHNDNPVKFYRKSLQEGEREQTKTLEKAATSDQSSDKIAHNQIPITKNPGTNVRKPAEVRANFASTLTQLTPDHTNDYGHDHENTFSQQSHETGSHQKTEPLSTIPSPMSDTGNNSEQPSSGEKTAGKISLEQAYQLWPKVRERIHQFDKVIEVMLAGCDVIRVDYAADLPVLVLEHESEALVNRLNSDRGTSVICKAGKEIFGTPIQVVTEIKKASSPDPSGGGRSGPKASTGVEPDKFQRKSYSRSSQVHCAPPPPPEETLTEPVSAMEVSTEYCGYEDEIPEQTIMEQTVDELLVRILGARKIS